MATVPESKLSFRELTYCITIFGLVVALLHQIGYWNHFDINILEYATIWDVAKFSVVPLVTTLVAFVGVWNLGNVVAEYVDTRRTSRGWRIGGVVLLLVAALVPVWLNDPVQIPTSLAFPGSIFVTAVFLQAGIDPFARVFREKPMRNACLFLVIFLPLMSLALGIQRALRIEHGRGGEIAMLPPDLLAAHGMSQADRLLYLGATEDYMFLLVADKRDVLVVRAGTFSGMVLSRMEPTEKTKSRK